MKIQRTAFLLTAALSLALFAGCDSKPSDSAPPPSGGEAKPTTVESVVKPVVDEATKVVEAAKPAVEKAAQDVQAAANSVVSDATAKANAMIEEAKKYIGETKYSEAMNVLQQLSSMKLTPEQEKLVADLKEQINKALAAVSGTNAASALGNLLKK